MKRSLLTLAIILALIVPAAAQEKEQKVNKLEELEKSRETRSLQDTIVADEQLWPEPKALEIDGDTSKIKSEEITTVTKTEDVTVIRIGNRTIRIIEEGNEKEFCFEKNEGKSRHRSAGSSFAGHVGGIEIGFNNFTVNNWNENSIPIDDYLDLNTAKSTNFNIILPPVSLGFTRHFGLTTSMGINFNNYRFDRNNSVAVNSEGIFGPIFPPEGVNYDKSKLATVYGIVPVILEVQIPVTYGSTINLGAGIIGAVKLGSHAKVVYQDGGKQKEKKRDDFNLNVLRYGVTARAGYEMIQVYGTFYLSPMFEKNKGPELYPFEVGIALTIND